jgi:dCMP deaminase
MVSPTDAPAPRHRASWDEYFMSIAQVVATRSTCPRKYVGAVIVKNRTILSTGYNGSIRGMPHCSDVGHMMEDGHCVATVHAEANAIIQAAKNGVVIDAATIYVTASPCWNCFKQIANAGIVRICFGEFYRDSRIFDIAQQIGIELVHIARPGVSLPPLTAPSPPTASGGE